MKKWLKENWDALTYADAAVRLAVTTRPEVLEAIHADAKKSFEERYGDAERAELQEKYFPGVAPPRVLPATEQLRTNLEKAATAYLQREQTLQREIADREAELADVRRARDAATAGLLELEGVPDLGVTVEQGPHGTMIVPTEPRVVENVSVEAASGEQLDALGRLYDVIRRQGSDELEADSTYRARIKAEHRRRAAGWGGTE
jgi:hypothetical protein